MNGALMEKIIRKKANIAVIGLGYVGLPLALSIADASFNVYGLDISQEKIEALLNGRSYVSDAGDEAIKRLVNKKFFPKTDFTILSDADVIIICVPTPLNNMKMPDLSYINSAVDEIIKFIKQGTLIILESTTYPGSTEELIVRPLEEKLNFKVGKDVFVCFSPERVDPSNKNFNIKNTPKVIGGSTKECVELAKTLYSVFIDEVIPVSSTKVAETVKLLENTFRSVNIAFINEMTKICEEMGIDIWEVIKAAATKPFGFMPFYPGPGIGGHCLPIDPAYFSWKAKEFGCYSRFIELTEEINNSMPAWVVDHIADILNSFNKSVKGSNILILGIAYKKDVGDVRESPAYEIIKLLLAKGAAVNYHDPYVPYIKAGDITLYSQNIEAEYLKNTDLVVIATDHSTIDYKFIIENSKIIYDTRNVTNDNKADNVILIGNGTTIN